MKSNTIKQLVLLLLSWTFGVSVLDVTGTGVESLAQGSENQLVFNRPSETNNSGVPGSLVGRGSRRPGEDLCGKSALPLTALAPYVPKPKTEKNPYPHRVLGLTIDKTPTFWFYIPYPSPEKLSAVFEIRELINGKPNLFHRQTIALPATPGLFSIQLKDKPLAVGQKYQWVLSVACIPNEPSANDSVTGWVQYVSKPELNSQLQQAKTTKQKIQLYAQSGIWHETIATLVRDLCVSDRKQAQIWFNDLMQSIGLTEIATKPRPPVLQNCPKL